MKWSRTDSFRADYRKLPADEREAFRSSLQSFNAACDAYVESGDPSVWPAGLRVKSVTGAPGVMEMTWSFSGPDGRATWQWSRTDDGSPAVLWRCIGDHRIFTPP